MNAGRPLRPAVFICVAVAAAAAFAIAVLHFTPGRTHPDERTAAPLLDVHIDGDHLHVSWNPNDARLRPARGGVLTVLDGPRRRTIPLDTAELKSGRGITYVPATDKVTVQLELSGATINPAQQTVLAVLRPARLQAASLQAPPPPDTTRVAPPAPMAAAPESRSSNRHLLQIAAIKYRSGEGLRSLTYRPAQPTREATPRVPDHFAKLLKSPVEIDVRIRVDRRGNVVNAQPVSQIGSLRASSDDQIVLAHAVVDAARQWRFLPAELHSRPVPSEMILSFRFLARG